MMKARLATMIILILSGQAHAALIFTDRTEWESALAGTVLVNEDFNNASSVFPSVLVHGDIVVLDSGLILEGQGSGGLAFIRPGWPPNFNTPHLETDFESTGTKVLFSAATGFNAFGFDYAQASFESSIYLTDNHGVSYSTAPNINNNEVLFFGVIAPSQFSSVSFSTAARDQDYKIDNFSYANSVPEPNVLALVLIGLIFLSRAMLTSQGWRTRRAAA